MDVFANLTSGFYPPPVMFVHARFGRWKKIRGIATEAEKEAVAAAAAAAGSGDGDHESSAASAIAAGTDADADADAGVDLNLRTAEGWTAAVADTPWLLIGYLIFASWQKMRYRRTTPRLWCPVSPLRGVIPLRDRHLFGRSSDVSPSS